MSHRVGARAAILAVSGALAVAVAGATAASAAAPPNQPFTRPLALPGGAGASASGLSVTPGGPSYIAGATSGAGGCVLFQMAHGGDSAKFLGRTAGGVGCALGAAESNGAPSLEVATTTAQGLITATTAPVKPHLQWSAPLAATTALPAIAIDPAPPTGTQADTFLIVQGADALPHVAVSTDGGATYSIGSSLINATDVPVDEWQGPGPLPIAGNVVARRDAGGLVLYSVFAAADGAQDRAAQQQAKTDHLNRVYGAVGVVTPALTPGGAPNVTWKDVLIWRTSPGTALNRALPQVGVDSAGQVYATFADGRHVYVKHDVDGLQWNASAPPVAVDAVGFGTPNGITANALPAIAGGGNGLVDLAWFSATGGKPHDTDPAADPLNSWSVLLAQSADAGRTWTVTPASGLLAVHQGALDPAAALQLGLDQATGAAVLAYTGDPTIPGLPSLFATRQCTGLSAVSGNALVNDCVASQPATAILPGTSCPGPQVTDPGGDAIDTSAGGTGLNAPSLDLLAARFNASDTGVQQLATLTLNSMSATLPNDVLQAWWVLTWTQGTTERYAQLTISQTNGPAYTTGLVNPDGSLAPGTSVPGALYPGANGTITFALAPSVLGNPTAGTTLSNISAATYARYVSAPLSSPQLVDRAPDAGTGADYGIGQVCDPATDLPEVPAAVLIPVVGSIIGLFFYWQRRRRPRSVEP